MTVLRRVVDAWWAPVAVCTVGWLVRLALSGSVLDLSIHDYVARSRTLPDVFHGRDPLSDYRNWSMLPLVAARIVGAGSPPWFAFVQWLAMVAGTVAVVAALARGGRARAAWGLTAGILASVPAAYSTYFAGSYDQVLVALLVAAVVIDARWAAAVVGLALGWTHAELGMLAAVGLLALGASGTGPGWRSRAALLAGIVVGRVTLMVWLRSAGGSTDRVDFARRYGIDRTAGYFADTWPVVLWSMLGAGWLVVAAALWWRRSRRLGLITGAWLAGSLGVVLTTVDQTRVGALLTFTLVLALAVDAAERYGARSRMVLAGAAVAGLVIPLWASLLGSVFRFADPFQIRWR